MLKRFSASIVSALVVGAALVPGAATAAAPVPRATAPRLVVAPHNGHHIVMHRTSAVQVMLTACEDCGYTWQVLRRPDASVARFVGRASTGSGVCAGPCVGGNANEFFFFAATGFGQTSVRLGYQGPGTSGVTRTLTLVLVVVRHGRSPAAHLHLVRTGDTLYRIGRAELGAGVSSSRLRALVHRVYGDNRETIGRNPGLLLPGEMLLVDPTGV